MIKIEINFQSSLCYSAQSFSSQKISSVADFSNNISGCDHLILIKQKVFLRIELPKQTL